MFWEIDLVFMDKVACVCSCINFDAYIWERRRRRKGLRSHIRKACKSFVPARNSPPYITHIPNHCISFKSIKLLLQRLSRGEDLSDKGNPWWWFLSQTYSLHYSKPITSHNEYNTGPQNLCCQQTLDQPFPSQSERSIKIGGKMNHRSLLFSLNDNWPHCQKRQNKTWFEIIVIFRAVPFDHWLTPVVCHPCLVSDLKE